MPDTPKLESKTSENKSQPLGNSAGWVADAIRSPRTIKTWLRVCVVLVVVLVLLVDNETSNTQGHAAFFSVIVALMLPPTFALSIFVMAVLTLFFGILVGWAWGSAAMAAGLAVRSSTLLARQQQKLQSSLVQGVPISQQIQSQTFHGIFLDPRTSAVYGAFLFIGMFALGSLRAYAPSLALLSIFGGIVLAVICATGPLLPTAQYTLPKLFIIPTCYYVAVAIVCLILIFPDSLSHIWLTSLKQDFWTHILDLLRMQSEALSSVPSDRETWKDITSRANEVRGKLTEGTDALSKQISLINLDCSVGRLGPTDLRQMNTKLKSAMFRATGLNSFQNFVNDTNLADEEEEKTVELLSRDDATPEMATNPYQTMRRNIREREIQHGHDLDSLVPILASSSADLRSACENGVTCVMDWFQECNSRRWAAYFSKPDTSKVKERHDKLVAQLNQLQAALEEFRSVHRSKLVQPYERFFDPKTRRLLQSPDDKNMFASRSLFICFVFLDTLDAFADHLLQVLKMVVDIDTERPKAKIWFPGRLSRVKDNIIDADFKGSAGPYSMGTATDPTSFDFPSNRSNSSTPDLAQEDGDENDEEDLSEPPSMPSFLCHRKLAIHGDSFSLYIGNRNPDAFPPTTMFGGFFVKLLAVFRFLKSPEGIFAFRLGIVSVALWIPAVCHSSAWLYYDNKGIWALIMAQTALAVYAGDQIAGILVRIVGIIFGLLFGMAVWYIGAGRGHGNPYGIVIATAVLLSICMFAQIAGPPTQKPLWSMVSTTVVFGVYFLVGYSWINANQDVFAGPGIGVMLGWKRALLVIIGFTAAFIVMMFPNPISSRVLVRKSLGAATREIGNIFAAEVEAFLAEEARARRGVYEKVEFVGPDKVDSDTKVSPKEKRVRKIGRRLITVATRLRGLAPSLSTAKFEPQLSGTWPHAQYEALFDIQKKIIGVLVLLIVSFAKLDTKWCSILVHRTPFLNPNFLSDIFSTLSILSDSLLTGRPLPACLPKLRDRLLYHECHKGHLRPAAQRQTVYESDSDEGLEKKQSTESSATEKELDFSGGKVDGSSIGLEELTLDVLLDEQLPAHSTAIVALSSIITRIDEVAGIVRILCGEASFRGYENLQRDYLDREEKTHGGGLASKMK
ncbi:hypothetical protein BYT27DRAFT_7177807 [Phlegmacium glaucopus]|nr:hypothetical protein BYT27DRAFT_7177807 [Phlegmacium glaucopus]